MHDYLHTFKLNKSLKRLQTIISFHSFNQRLDHPIVCNTGHGRGEWCNFYLFGSTDMHRHPFHTNCNINDQHKRNLGNIKNEKDILDYLQVVTVGKDSKKVIYH